MKITRSNLILLIGMAALLGCTAFGFYSTGYTDGYSKGTREATDTCVAAIKSADDKCVETIKSLGK